MNGEYERLLDIGVRLLEWEQTMGGFDAPPWQELRVAMSRALVAPVFESILRCIDHARSESFVAEADQELAEVLALLHAAMLVVSEVDWEAIETGDPSVEGFPVPALTALRDVVRRLLGDVPGRPGIPTVFRQDEAARDRDA